MPPMRLFGRPWHFASDDLGLPAACGVAFLSAWSAVIAVGLVKLGPASVECAELYLLKRFALALLCCFLLTAVLDALICITSMRGAVMEHHKRWMQKPLVYAALASMTCIVGVNSWGTYLAAATSCKEPLSRSTSPLFVLSLLVYTTWGIIAALVLLAIISFSVHHDDAVKAWEARCSCLALCSCGLSHSASVESQAGSSSSAVQPALRKVAQLVAIALDPLQFTLSDISLAMMLVGVWHRSHIRPRQLWRIKSISEDSLNAEASPEPRRAPASPSHASSVELPAAVLQRHRASQGSEQGPLDSNVSSQDLSIDISQLASPHPAHQHPELQSAQQHQHQHQQHQQHQQQQQQQQQHPCNNEVHPETLQQAAHFMQFALGVYGWKMHIWQHRRRAHRCCALCFGRRCGCCCGHEDYSGSPGEQLPAGAEFTPSLLRRLGRAMQLGERLTREAIQQIAGLTDSQLLYVNYTNTLQGVLPYFVALDPSTSSVVVAVRGTMTLEDCITDLLCLPAAIEVEGWAGAHTTQQVMNRSDTAAAGQQQQQQQQQPKLYAHEGMYRCSTAVMADLARHRLVHDVMAGSWQQLQQRLGPRRGPNLAALLSGMAERAHAPWQLVLTGHSLGAGVAALLTLRLQEMFPGRVRCWCFSPPGALMSPEASALLEPICTSVVIGKDMFPRLTVRTTQQLCDQMMLAAALCKVPKAQVLLGAALGKAWHEQELFHDSLAKVHPAVRMEYKKYIASRDEQDKDPRMIIAKKFIPPGRMLCLSRSKRREPSGGLRCGRQTERKLFTPCWCSAESVVEGGLVVSGSMFLEHFPDRQSKVLQRVADEARTGLRNIPCCHGC